MKTLILIGIIGFLVGFIIGEKVYTFFKGE